MSLWTWVGVVGLGGLGAVARFALDGVISRRSRAELPYGTLIVNLSGTFVLGLLTGIALRGAAATLIGTATIGSYTTFSTWMLESQRLAEDGAGTPAAVNLGASLLLGLGAAALGQLVGHHL
jgi:CrcB protein